MSFEETLDKLTPKQRKVLKDFLNGLNDLEITKAIEVNDPSTVRQHISKVCKQFGYGGEGFSYRKDLIELFIEYKPEWVCQAYKNQYQAKPPAIHFDPPGSPLALSSPFYIQRDRQEPYLAVVRQPGALLRIRAPHKMGKTSLLYRLRNQLREEDYVVVTINLRSAVEQATVRDLPQFLQWFCSVVQDALDLEPQRAIVDLPQTKNETTKYFQKTILGKLQAPLVLILDEADWLFEHPTTATDFFMLLRGWHEFAKDPDKQVWEQLRLVIAHATDDYVKFATSPFENVGFIVDLAPLNQQQVQSLAKSYELTKVENTDLDRLIQIVGGHPYLIQKALFHLKCSSTQTLVELLRLALTLQGIYATHLTELSQKLKSQELLNTALKQISHSSSTRLTPEQVFKLEGMGLIKRDGNQVQFSCELYRQFFQNWA